MKLNWVNELGLQPTAYVTPLISTTNLLVKSKGRYTLRDYLRNTLPIYGLQVGALFVLLVWFE